MKDTPAPRELKKCADCACFNVRKASRVITQFFDRNMEQAAGLRGTQFTILAMLGAAGPLAVTALARHLVMDRTTLTRNLRPLEKRGVIAITRGEDQRTRAVTLTGDGAALLAEAYPHWERAQKRVIKKLGKNRFKLLLDNLHEVSVLLAGE